MGGHRSIRRPGCIPWNRRTSGEMRINPLIRPEVAFKYNRLGTSWFLQGRPDPMLYHRGVVAAAAAMLSGKAVRFVDPKALALEGRVGGGKSTVRGWALDENTGVVSQQNIVAQGAQS